MKIRTQFIVSVVVFGAILITLAVSLAITNGRIARYNEQEENANNIERSSRELSYLTNSYLLYGESQQRTRWESAFDSLSNEVSRLDQIGSEEQVVVNNIRSNLAKLKVVFAEVSDRIEGASETPGSFFDRAFIQVSWSRMEVQNQGIIFDASRLSEIVDDRLDEARQTSTRLLSILVVIFTLYLFFNYLLVYRRTLKSISELKDGTRVIGSGNLDYTVPEKHNDEVGDLSRAFNQMTTDLKSVTTSKAELEREIDERKKTEEALKESEERFLKAFHASPAAQTIARLPEGRWIEVNDSFLRMSEYTREEVIGRTSTELNLIDPNERTRILRLFSEKGNVQNYEVNVRTKTGKSITVLSSNEKISLNGRDHALSIMIDITLRKRADELKDEFIGMVSHELKTPLTVMMGALYTVTAKGVSEKDAQELIQEAIHSTDTLASIVENLLDLSRSQADRLVLQIEQADIGQIARDVAQKLQTKSAIHRLNVYFPEGLPAVTVDPVRVERVLFNLVENAIKYSPKGGEVRVSARLDNNNLVVCVSDQGPGISPDDQKKLFQSFEQLAMTNRRAMQGVGLGLKVCRTLVEAHGGRIWVEAKPGIGSSFFFTIPIKGVTTAK